MSLELESLLVQLELAVELEALLLQLELALDLEWELALELEALEQSFLQDVGDLLSP